jgi:hypothetical protein
MQPEELLGNNQENGKKESPLKSLETDLVLFSDSIKEIAEEIIEELSKYPIFIAHQHEAKIGELIIDKDELSTDWNIHASTLEEFIEKGIINSEKQEFFKQNYKDPNKFICVFVMVPEGANFIFYPYK